MEEGGGVREGKWKRTRGRERRQKKIDWPCHKSRPCKISYLPKHLVRSTARGA